MGKFNIGKPKKPISVGEEFVTWAETQWGLDKKYQEDVSEPGSESCPYSILRNAFIEKINDIIRRRISDL